MNGLIRTLVKRYKGDTEKIRKALEKSKIFITTEALKKRIKNLKNK